MLNRLAAIVISPLVFLAVFAPAASAQTSSDVVYIRLHAMQIQVINARVTAVSSGAMIGNTAVVAPGASITVEGDYVIFFSSNPDDYTFCPECVVQQYIAWFPEAAAAGASPVNLGLWSGQNFGPGDTSTEQGATAGHFVFNTTAPTTPGEYYIGNAETLDFDFLPTAPGSGGFDLFVGVVGPPQYASFLISVANSPPQPCPGDSNGDGVVDFNDIVTSLGNWLNVCF